jgi:hypothetical protein
MIYDCFLHPDRGLDVVDVDGGFAAIKNQELFETTTFVCPSTLK